MPCKKPSKPCKNLSCWAAKGPMRKPIKRALKLGLDPSVSCNQTFTPANSPGGSLPVVELFPLADSTGSLLYARFKLSYNSEHVLWNASHNILWEGKKKKKSQNIDCSWLIGWWNNSCCLVVHHSNFLGTTWISLCCSSIKIYSFNWNLVDIIFSKSIYMNLPAYIY